MTIAPQIDAAQKRTELVERALFRGANLTLGNRDYLRTVRTLTDVLLADDRNPRDLTVTALDMDAGQGSAILWAREPGVAAGLAEVTWCLEEAGLEVTLENRDGCALTPGEVLLRAEGSRSTLLCLERVALNIVQRMSGIATLTQRLQARASSASASVRVVATRKTPWGLLDKRAVHLGGGGTHRLGLGDAILIKNNHLALIADSEVQAAPTAIEKAWRFREEAAFIEVEVRSQAAAVAAARMFRDLRRGSSSTYPCLLMLDNMTAAEIVLVLEVLHGHDLWDDVLIEASGAISESNIGDYAQSGVDVISVGALTHSSRALDLSQRIS